MAVGMLRRETAGADAEVLLRQILYMMNHVAAVRLHAFGPGRKPGGSIFEPGRNLAQEPLPVEAAGDRDEKVRSAIAALMVLRDILAGERMDRFPGAENPVPQGVAGPDDVGKEVVDPLVGR